MGKAPEKGTAPSIESLPETVDPFAEELAKQIGPLVSKDQRVQIVARVLSLTQEERFSGPIAHPRHLREYEQIVPGSADRIICMAENEMEHGRKLQDVALKADIDDTKSGRRYGFFALMALILSALACVYMDKEGVALAFLGMGVIGTVGLFIKGKNGSTEN